MRNSRSEPQHAWRPPIGAVHFGPHSAQLRANPVQLRVRLITSCRLPPEAEIKRSLTKPADYPDVTLTHDATLTQQIIGLAMRVHTRLGPGLLESAYERCLCHEFDLNGLPYTRQVELPLQYDNVQLECGYRADIIVRDEVLLEIKSVEHVLPLHEAQLLTYLRLSDCLVGLLLNFNTVSLKQGIRRRVR
jgi:GxxExxY protein